MPATVPADVSEAFFDLALIGGILFAPVRNAASEVADFSYVRLNPVAQRLLALPERPPETFLTRYPHARQTGIFAFYRDAYESGEARQAEFNYQHDGLDNYFHLAARRVGEQLLVSFTDTSEQPRTAVETALRESQAREQAARAEAEQQRAALYRVFEQAPAMVCIFQGPQHTFEFVNPPYQALVGERPLVGKPIADAMPELAGQPIFGLLDTVYHTGEPFHATEMLVQLDHANAGARELEQRYYNFIYQARRDGHGTIDGILVFAYEVTPQVLARRQVQELNEALESRVQERTHQLSEQQQLLRQILGQVPAAIATLSGPEHRFTFFNELYQQLSAGRTALGLTVAEVFSEVVEQGFLGLLDQVYATGEPFVGTDVPIQLYDAQQGRNRAYYVDFIYQPLFDGQSRPTGILAFILDVTDRAKARRAAAESQGQVQALNEELAAINEELRATNEELADSNTRLTRTNHDLDTFVYTASHDLKAPITNIESILHALRETLPEAVQQDEVVTHVLGLLDHTVSRFRTTIDQLTDLTRLQQTYNEPAELLLLGPIVAGVLADLAPVVAAAAAQVHLTVPGELRVSFAPASLRSIVYNLLSNAVKYRAPERPAQVWLRAEQQPGRVVLTVRDNGLGLTESQQGRLFGVFQRLHTHVEGTGVGLYMIKRLIENAGARIAVTSAPGVGSTFTVIFPN